jgi:hypothetical protein
VADPLLGVMLTVQMVRGAVDNLGNRLAFFGKDLLPSPLLFSLKFGLAGNLLRIRSVRSALLVFLGRRKSGRARFVNLCSKGKDRLLFLSGGAPFASENASLVLVLSGIHEGRNSNVPPFAIGILLALDEVTKVLPLGHAVALEDVDEEVVGCFPSSLKGDDLCLYISVELSNVGVKSTHLVIQLRQSFTNERYSGPCVNVSPHDDDLLEEKSPRRSVILANMILRRFHGD